MTSPQLGKAMSEIVADRPAARSRGTAALTGPLPALAALSARLGLHHFTHLRAVAEGVAVVDAARLYLAIDHAAQAAGVHRLVVDRVRALARRRGDSRWRLIGIEIRDPQA